jgi:putative toxin-antitoxin system antitoxin component (TIGR02293 family)
MSLSKESAGAYKTGAGKTNQHSIKPLDTAFNRYLMEMGLHVSQGIKSIGTSSGTFGEYVNDHLLMVAVIKKGITYTLFEEIQKLASLTNKDWADILNISPRSLQRYKDQNQIFKPIQTEKIIELGEIFILGNEVFGDPVKFKSWLEAPSFALGGVAPSALLSDSFGQELVINELTRINYGIFS